MINDLRTSLRISLDRGRAEFEDIDGDRNMLVQTSQGQSGSAHVVVLGNEKGGSGKSTTALHIAVALMKAGQRVATIDLDCRQQSFTRYISNRSIWARRTGNWWAIVLLPFLFLLSVLADDDTKTLPAHIYTLF